MITRIKKNTRTRLPGGVTRRRWFRKALLLPSEHGSWSWLLVPYMVGATISRQWSLASLLVLLGGLSVFLVRQPATAWLRIRQGRGRRSDEPIAMVWTISLLLLGGVSLLGLLSLRRLALLWLLPPVVALLVMYLTVAQLHRARVRSAGMEIAGAIGLAVMAPAAYAAGSGQLDATAWLIWLLMALQNVLGVFYVRLRIADTHDRDERRLPLVVAHVAGLLLAALCLAVYSQLWLALLPFVFYLARAIWLTLSKRPVPDMKRFGFTEVGVELISGLWLVVISRL